MEMTHSLSQQVIKKMFRFNDQRNIQSMLHGSSPLYNFNESDSDDDEECEGFSFGHNLTNNPVHNNLIKQLLSQYPDESGSITTTDLIGVVVLSSQYKDVTNMNHPQILEPTKSYYIMGNSRRIHIYDYIPTLKSIVERTGRRKLNITESVCKKLIDQVVDALKAIKKKGEDYVTPLTPTNVFVKSFETNWDFVIAYNGFLDKKFDNETHMSSKRSFKDALASLGALVLYALTGDENFMLKLRFFGEQAFEKNCAELKLSKSFTKTLYKLFAIPDMNEIQQSLKDAPLENQSSVSINHHLFRSDREQTRSPSTPTTPVSQPPPQTKLSADSYLQDSFLELIKVESEEKVNFTFPREKSFYCEGKIDDYNGDDEDDEDNKAINHLYKNGITCFVKKKQDRLSRTLKLLIPDASTIEYKCQGGYGEIYRVQTPNNCLALKCIPFSPPNLVNDMKPTTKKETALREFKKRFDHKHTLKIYDSCEVAIRYPGTTDFDMDYYILVASEYLEEGDISENCGKIFKMPVSIIENTCWIILNQLASALNSMYSNDQHLHRDIKPQNILLKHFDIKDSKIHVVLGDFGTVKSQHSTTDNAFSQGTDGYKAPEVVANMDYSDKSDIYSLGVTMIKFLVGNLSDLETEIELTKKDLNPIFINLIKRMINKEPKERPNYPEILSVSNNYVTDKSTIMIFTPILYFDTVNKGTVYSGCKYIDSKVFTMNGVEIPREHAIAIYSKLKFTENFKTLDGKSSFSKGDIVKVKSINENGWIQVEKSSKLSGLVPFGLLSSV